MPIRNLWYQQIASKGLKTKILQQDSLLRNYIPHTAWYQEETLRAMLDQYHYLFIKPDKGGGGVGIIRVKKLTGEQYECKTLYRRKVVSSRELPTLIKAWTRSDKRYLIQQGIKLATLKGRPFDLRLMLQRQHTDWELTGVAAKIAAPGKIVTNFCKGGQPYAAKDAVRKVYGQWLAKEKTAELKNLAYQVAEVLNKRFSGLRELGIDAGIDNDGKIWIFEVNTRPDFSMFKKLKNLQMYNKIRSKHLRIV